MVLILNETTCSACGMPLPICACGGPPVENQEEFGLPGEYANPMVPAALQPQTSQPAGYGAFGLPGEYVNPMVPAETKGER